MPASSVVTVPAHVLPHRSPAELLRLARRGLSEAAVTQQDGLRFATAHLAALRAAAAVLAVRAQPAPRRRNQLTSVWALLIRVAPDLGEWAAFFAAGATRRAAAEAGVPRVVSAREADDVLRAAEQFTAVVEVALGLAQHRPPQAPTIPPPASVTSAPARVTAVGPEEAAQAPVRWPTLAAA